MKKVLLSICVLALSASLNAQTTVDGVAKGFTLTKDWTSTDVPTSNAIFGSGYNGDIYVKKYGTDAELYCYTYNESTKKVEYSTVEGITAAGTSFNFDSKGNAVVRATGHGATANFKVVLWNATTKEVSEEIDLTQAFKDLGATIARMDYMGRGVGDIFSEAGGAFFFALNETTEVIKCYFANGEYVAAKSKLIDAPTSADTQTIAQPLTDDPGSDKVAYRKRGSIDIYYQNDASKWVAYKRVGDIKTTVGHDVVTFYNFLFTIESAGNTYLDGFQIVDRGSNKVVATIPATLSDNTAGNITALNVQKISDNKAYIYHFHPKKFVTRYTFTVSENLTTAIETVDVDANAPVEYYNLQGVKVENPSNGIFIKKQGSRTSKVVL